MAKKIEEGKAKNESKVNKEGNSKKGGKKPTVSDVKEANKAVLNFPADANPNPEIKVSHSNDEAFPNERVVGQDRQDNAPEASAHLNVTETKPVETTTTPSPTLEETPDPIDDNPLNPGVFGNPIVINSGDVATVVNETPFVNEPEPVVEPVTVVEPVVEPEILAENQTEEEVKPTQEELEEKVIEKWYNSQNKPSEVNHFELANSAAGINMSKFSAYEAIVGKFKFKRSHAGANWQITVDESK